MSTQEKHELVIDEWFIKEFDRVKAWKKYNPDCTDESARSSFARMLQIDAVQDYIQSKYQKVKEGLNVQHEELLKQLIMLREARIDDYVEIYEKIITEKDAEGKGVEVDRYMDLRFKPFTGLSNDQKKCIKSVKMGKYGIEMILHDVSWSIEKIARHIGFYEKDNAQLSNKEINIAPIEFVTEGYPID